MRHGVRQVFRRFPVEYGEVDVRVGDAQTFRGRRDNAVSLEETARVVVHVPQTPENIVRVTCARHKNANRVGFFFCTVLEVTEIDLSQIAGAQRLTQWRQTSGAAARRVVHTVCEAAERLGSPRSAYH